MRAIKFRLWDTANKRMVAQPFVLFPDHRGFFWRVAPNTQPMRSDLDGVLMQYIGLQDRHGTDIYEGDILQNKEIAVCGAVTWVSNGPGFTIIDPNETGAFVIHDQWEIIGNIYETPELLKS